jgi:nucleotide-binding universal stress UspA family protein
MQIHEASPPSLITGPGSAHPTLERPRIDVVLACVDVSSGAASGRARPVLRAAELVATIVPRVPAALYVVHAGALVGESILACPLRGLPPDRFRALAARAQTLWRGRLESLCREVLSSTPTGVLVQRGDARRVIPALCRRLRADVVVLGRASRARFGGFAPGGLASALSGRVDCDMLVVGTSGGRTPVPLRAASGGRS